MGADEVPQFWETIRSKDWISTGPEVGSSPIEAVTKNQLVPQVMTTAIADISGFGTQSLFFVQRNSRIGSISAVAPQRVFSRSYPSGSLVTTKQT